MNCFYHADVPGNGQCQCGKVLCSSCMQVTNNTGLCSECAVKFNNAYQTEVIKTLAFSVIAFIIGIFLGGLGVGYLFFAVFWGRRFAKDFFGKVLNGWFVSLNIFFVILVIKFVVYWMLGCVTAPFGLIFAIKKFLDNKKQTAIIIQNQVNLVA